MNSKKKRRGQMSEAFCTAMFLSLSGGLQDVYTYLFRGKVFANAQTGNSSVPVGRYNAILKEAKIVPRNGGGLSVSISFVVTDGAYKGRYAFTSYGLHKNGLPYFKGFLQMIQLPLTRLSDLEKALPMFPGHRCVINVQQDKKDPQYTRTYVDRYLGMGNLAEYLSTPAQPAAQDDFAEVNEPDDFPFN